MRSIYEKPASVSLVSVVHADPPHIEVVAEHDADDPIASAWVRHAEVLASRPIPSLMAVKQTIVEPTRAAIAAALEREYAQFAELMGGAANADALAEFADRRGGR